VIRIGLAVLLLVAGFYVAWPAYTGYRIKTALETSDPGLLAAKIDFDQVRTSLRPAVTAEVTKAAAAGVQAGGAANAELLQQMTAKLLPTVVDKVLAETVTPETLLRVYKDGGDLKATLTKIMSEKTGGGLGSPSGAAAPGAGGLGDLVGAAARSAGIDPGKALGGLFGKKDSAPAEPAATQPAPATPAAPSGKGVSLANIKSFGFSGPLSFYVGVAKDPASAVPDVTADMAFTGGDWKIVAVRPKN
jgi:Protein of unknown function (DUF2939)